MASVKVDELLLLTGPRYFGTSSSRSFSPEAQFAEHFSLRSNEETDTIEFGGPLSAILIELNRIAQEQVERVTKQRRHLLSDYERVQFGIQELRNLTDGLRKSVHLLAQTKPAPSVESEHVSPDVSGELDKNFTKDLHGEIAELNGGQFSLLKDVADLGLLDAKLIRRAVLPLLEQASSDGELSEFSTSLKEQFLRKDQFFKDLRINEQLIRLKAAAQYPIPKKPHADTFRASEMESLVRDHISLLARSKTAEVNYASEKCGATVVRTSGQEMEGKPASAILTDQTRPGEAWSILSLPASVVVKLCLPVRVSAVSLEHIAGFFSGLHLTESAPADFEILAHTSAIGANPQSLLKCTFDQAGESLQRFPISRSPREAPLRYLELKVYTNHGNPCKTSVYQLKVHGEPTTEDLDKYKLGI
ncbi:putative SUN domain-containing protein 1 [Hypsibius exemplaris]|uniref:SUN domain-containing protein 1 n=1 Tax=Hypsibius exemplaris TaxID=2072580 RepID=A0A1W0XD87_HYPEX|nr:putative SUN domain-containing protein 1 [Hypsibius exemplaris]